MNLIRDYESTMKIATHLFDRLKTSLSKIFNITSAKRKSNKHVNKTLTKFFDVVTSKSFDIFRFVKSFSQRFAIVIRKSFSDLKFLADVFKSIVSISNEKFFTNILLTIATEALIRRSVISSIVISSTVVDFLTRRFVRLKERKT